MEMISKSCILKTFKQKLQPDPKVNDSKTPTEQIITSLEPNVQLFPSSAKKNHRIALSGLDTFKHCRHFFALDIPLTLLLTYFHQQNLFQSTKTEFSRSTISTHTYLKLNRNLNLMKYKSYIRN